MRSRGASCADFAVLAKVVRRIWGSVQRIVTG